jgi:hypothetical protein
MPRLAFALLLLAALLPLPHDAAPEPPGLSAILPDPDERRRYLSTLHRLAMRPITPQRLAERAKLKRRVTEVRAALRADPRFERVREPLDGPERYALRPEHRHTVQLRREAKA